MKWKLKDKKNRWKNLVFKTKIQIVLKQKQKGKFKKMKIQILL